MKKLGDIPARNYQGYVWYSNDPMPETLDGKNPFQFKEEHLNPFVVEALLFDEIENIYVAVRHTGEYHITAFELSNLPKNLIIEKDKNYISHPKIKTQGLLNFCKIWEPAIDDQCEGFPVLKLKATVFTGFTQNSNK